MMTFGRRLRAIVLLPLLLTACAEANLASYAVKEAAGPDKDKGGPYKIGKPYQIQGVWYYPSEDYEYDETGVASWYGPDFHGKFTANGEVFDQNEVTAAHRTLPMPCFVRVTNLANGRSLVVRVNDRGPFAHGRILDLSRRAAQLLGIELKGTAPVHVQIMADESRALAMKLKGGTEATPLAASPRPMVSAESLPAPGTKDKPKPIARAAPPPAAAATAAPIPDSRQLDSQAVAVVPVKPTHLYIQAGAFSRYENANRTSAALSPLGTASITQVRTQGGSLFRVRMGPIARVDDADALLEKVISSGYPDAKLVVD